MIDKRLNDSLSAFDAKLQTEQQKIAKERDARQTSVLTVASVDSSGSNGPGLSRNRSDRSRDSGDGSRDSGNLKSEKAAAQARAAAGGTDAVHGGGGAAVIGGNGAIANEVPDGSDDDVVARRLRKAAEQETDPELKDKLWKEYVEYKKNLPGK